MDAHRAQMKINKAYFRKQCIGNNSTGRQDLRSLYPRALLLLPFLAFFAACDPSDNNRLSIVAGGDCLLDRHNGEFPASAPWDARWEHLARAAEGCDAWVINLETTVGPVSTAGSPKSKRFVFRAPPDRLDPLARFPRPIAAIANNHSLDYGPKGLLETISELDRRGIAHAGGGKSRADSMAAVPVEADGITARVLSFGFDNDAESYSEEEGACIAPLRLKGMVATVEANRASADLIIVMLHWGQEYETRFSGHQAEMAHALIDAGADAIIGTGPHVLQGIELYRGSLICYSLGNLVFDDLGDAERTASILVRITLESHRRGAIKRGASKRFAIMPLRTRDPVQGPREPSPDDARSIIRAIASRSPNPSILSSRPEPSKSGTAWFRIKPK